MPGGELPKLAEYERPAPPATSAPAVPGNLMPSGGFAQMAAKLASKARPAPMRMPTIRRNLASLLIVIAVLLEGLSFLATWPVVRDVHEHGKVAIPKDLDDPRLAVAVALGGAAVVAFIAFVLVSALWWFATVNRALTRYPRLNASPSAAVFWFLVPIARYWKPWQHLRAAGQCEDGTTRPGVDVWHVMVVLRELVVTIPMSLLVGLRMFTSVPMFVGMSLFVFVYDLLLAIVAVVAMHSTDLATSGHLYDDSATPAPATA
jgi:hypothetical protein